jgi:fructuronate reductase
MMSEEIMPTLNMPAGVNLGAYRDALIERFANPGLQHQTWQIAMDGSQKLPQRVLNTIRDRLGQNASFERLALCVAGWMRYVSGFDEKGNEIDVRDPLAQQLLAIGRKHKGDPAAMVGNFCAINSIFGEDLVQDERFSEGVTAALERLYRNGAGNIVI